MEIGASDVVVLEADLGQPERARDFLAVMDDFACDPMSGGTPLAPDVRSRLVPALHARDDVTVLLAYVGSRVVGLATCIEGFSTFAARPLWNLHDMAVLSPYRGRGIGTRLLEEIERRARARGYCKITLEVIATNARAQAVYLGAGFDGGAPHSERPATLFWEKRIEV